MARQDHDDIFLAVPVAADVTAGEVSVGFRARSLRVAIGGEVIVTGELPQPVHPEDCTWQFGARRRPSSRSRTHAAESAERVYTD